MSLEEQFQAAAVAANSFKKRPSDAELLEIYSLYKQATIGDVNTDKPGILNLKAKAKWEAWSGRKGTSQDDAKASYKKLVDELSSKYS